MMQNGSYAGPIPPCPTQPKWVPRVSHSRAGPTWVPRGSHVGPKRVPCWSRGSHASPARFPDAGPRLGVQGVGLPRFRLGI